MSAAAPDQPGRTVHGGDRPVAGWLAIGVALLLAQGALAAHAQEPGSWARLREIYIAAAERESALHEGTEAIAALRAGGLTPAEQALVDAYEGALLTLRAKYTSWPVTRLRQAREGLQLLDRTVAAHPGAVEIRYLRLMSCFYLPRLLGRGWSVDEDLAMLARTLPTARDGLPPPLHEAITRFVLQHGSPGPAEREALETALGR